MATKRSVLDGLQEYVKKLKAALQTSERISEENTKARFVNPLLKILGWDPELGDVDYEKYITAEGHADIALKFHNKPKAIIEVKRLGIDLQKEHADQSMRYSKGKVRWAIVTNGRQLIVYDIKHRISRPRLLFSLDLADAKRFRKAPYIDALLLISKKNIGEKLDEAANEYRRMEKGIRNDMRKMKEGVTKDFLKSAIGIEEAKLTLIHQAIGRCRHGKVGARN